MKLDKKDMLLYAVTDRSWLGCESLSFQVERILEGGVTFVQHREKMLRADRFLEEARTLKGVCEKFGVPFVINDNVDIAIASGAHGVHIGQEDMEAKTVRRLIGKDMILGVSVRSVEEAIRAERDGADYLGAGAVFHTDSKPDAQYISHELLKEICSAVSIPVVAIGGINKENIKYLSQSGISGAAVISAIFAQDDLKKAAAELRKEIEGRLT